MNNKYYIGVMSGTSLDAVDCVLADFQHPDSPTIIDTYSQDIPADKHKILFSLNQSQNNEIEIMLAMDVYMGKLIADCCNSLLTQAKVSPEDIIAIGSHGQTIRHYPGGQLNTTLQIGDANIIAEKTGITTIADFRRRDMAVNGQGAPLVPAFHQAVFRDNQHSTVIVNIGGISNITCLPQDSNKPVLGFDTGPGNTLIDLYCQQQFNMAFDQDGQLASQGQINNVLLASLQSDPFFTQAFPKSTGRDYFGEQWLNNKLDIDEVKSMAKEDIVATLTELTAQTIIDAIKLALPKTGKVFICGGGAKNQFLMNRLNQIAQAQLTLKTAITSTDEKGYPAEHIECLAFAWLAQQTLAKQAGNIPSVTGASHEVILGAIYQ